MKFLLCLVLCFVAAQAGHLGVPSALGYASPYTTYSAGLPSVYNAALPYSGYSGYPTTYAYNGGIPVPPVYSSLDLGSQLLDQSGYAAPALYSSPSIYTSSPSIYTSSPSVYTSSPSVYTSLLKK